MNAFTMACWNTLLDNTPSPIWVLDVGDDPVPLVPPLGGGYPQLGTRLRRYRCPIWVIAWGPLWTLPHWVRDFVAMGAPN